MTLSSDIQQGVSFAILAVGIELSIKYKGFLSYCHRLVTLIPRMPEGKTQGAFISDHTIPFNKLLQKHMLLTVIIIVFLIQ